MQSGLFSNIKNMFTDYDWGATIGLKTLKIAKVKLDSSSGYLVLGEFGEK